MLTFVLFNYVYSQIMIVVSRKFRKIPLSFFLICIIILYILNDQLKRRIYSRHIAQQLRLQQRQNKVVIGTVSCRQGNQTKSNEEVEVLIKSVLISALLNSVDVVEFHIFLEYLKDEDYFRKTVAAYKFSGKVVVKFYSAVNVIPVRYREGMLHKKSLFRCTFVRMFFERVLPNNLDAIIYLDTDFIITGNIATLWQELLTMNTEQLIGVVPNHLPEKKVNYSRFNCFGTPYVPPLGLNAGLAIMNLTKMRKYKFAEKMMTLYDIYSTKYELEDQILLNIMTYHDPGILKLLPCVHNVRCSSCEQWSVCKDAHKYGIQSVHGASGQFEPGGRFHYIYQHYLKFNMSGQTILEDLVMPILKMKEPKNKQARSGKWQKCATPINRLLFRNISQFRKINL